MDRRRRKNPNAKGFTLIEVMIVIAIVLALSALVGVFVLGRRDEANIKLTQTDMNNIASAIDMFELDFNRVPTEDEGLAVLWDESILDPEDAETGSWQGYMQKPLASDRWGTEWFYRVDSRENEDLKYELFSAGPDREEGTEDDLRLFDDESSMGDEFGGMPPPPSGGD